LVAAAALGLCARKSLRACVMLAYCTAKRQEACVLNPSESRISNQIRKKCFAFVLFSHFRGYFISGCIPKNVDRI
jgi:hypothetical protein